MRDVGPGSLVRAPLTAQVGHHRLAQRVALQAAAAQVGDLGDARLGVVLGPGLRSALRARLRAQGSGRGVWSLRRGSGLGTWGLGLG